MAAVLAVREREEALAYARIAAAIDFIYRTSEDVWARQIRHTLLDLSSKKAAS